MIDPGLQSALFANLYGAEMPSGSVAGVQDRMNRKNIARAMLRYQSGQSDAQRLAARVNGSFKMAKGAFSGGGGSAAPVKINRKEGRKIDFNEVDSILGRYSKATGAERAAGRGRAAGAARSSTQQALAGATNNPLLAATIAQTGESNAAAGMTASDASFRQEDNALTKNAFDTVFQKFGLEEGSQAREDNFALGAAGVGLRGKELAMEDYWRKMGFNLDIEKMNRAGGGYSPGGGGFQFGAFGYTGGSANGGHASAEGKAEWHNPTAPNNMSIFDMAREGSRVAGLIDGAKTAKETAWASTPVHQRG